MTALVQRRIDATITLAKGQLGDEVGSTVTISGLRIGASINALGGNAQGQAFIKIFGLSLSVMNKLTGIGPLMNEIRLMNTIQISAGNAGDALTVAYQGVINTAYADLNSSPEVSLNIESYGAQGAAIKPVAASSFLGSTDVATIMAQFARQAGYAFRNSGVDMKLSNPYFYGTTLDQIKSCARAAGINYSIENSVLRIWKKFGYTNDEIILLSPQTGLVGYPILNSQYIVLRSIFIPNVHIGQRVTVSGSDIAAVNGTWAIYAVNHTLESMVPRGQWFTDLKVRKDVG